MPVPAQAASSPEPSVREYQPVAELTRVPDADITIAMPQQLAPEPQQPSTPTPQPQPVLDLERALKESGLQLVETRSGALAQLPPEEPAFVPAKRERRPPPPALNEPLVQVETGRPGNPPA